MARRSTGQVVERQTKRGTVFALRFYAAGERRYETLGTDAEGWNRRKADDELAATMAAVRAGRWRPSQAEAKVREVPTFHEFASDWLAAREGELRPRTVADYTWALSYHLLPFFKGFAMNAITPQDVDRYKAEKLLEGKLGGAQINKTLKVLAMIYDLAIEYELTERANPARGRRRRVKVGKPQRTWVEPEQLMALIESASSTMKPVLALLAGAGLRVGEAVALDWRAVNLATGTLTVGQAKTDAGTGRDVDLPAGLIEALSEWKARSPKSASSDPVLVARTGRRQAVTNIDHRIKAAIKAANVKLAELQIEPISEKVTPHSLRRTYASLRAAVGDHPVYIAEQLGHEDPAFTFRVYQRSVKRRERLAGEYLEAFDRALDWASMARSEPQPVAVTAYVGAR
jgi:integrase